MLTSGWDEIRLGAAHNQANEQFTLAPKIEYLKTRNSMLVSSCVCLVTQQLYRLHENSRRGGIIDYSVDLIPLHKFLPRRMLMHKSALIMLLASSINTAFADEVAAPAPSRQSRDVMATERPQPLEPQQTPPICDDQTCGFKRLDDTWKRGILPFGFNASGVNDFKVENAGSVILDRAKAAETEKMYEPSPLKLTFKFLGMDCEIGTFTAGSRQEGGTRCPF